MVNLFLKFKYPPKFGQDPPNQKEIGPRENQKKKKKQLPPTTMVISVMKIFVFFLDEILFLLALLAYQGKGYLLCLDSL
jgi:hypothetical protein